MIEPEQQTVAQGTAAVIRCDSSDPQAPIVWSKTNEQDIANVPDVVVQSFESRTVS